MLYDNIYIYIVPHSGGQLGELGAGDAARHLLSALATACYY